MESVEVGVDSLVSWVPGMVRENRKLIMGIGSTWLTITSTGWIPVNTPRNRRNRRYLDCTKKVVCDGYNGKLGVSV